MQRAAQDHRILWCPLLSDARKIGPITRLPHSDSRDPRRVMEITFEVARLGESGLDYANPEKK